MKKPWVMTQHWRDLVFLHWPVPAEWLRPYVPKELEIDLYGGKGWIGVVPFVAEKTRLRFFPPIPGVRSYRELNVRTYVRHRGKPGVFFFSLDADSVLAVEAASTGKFLPYRYAQMKFIKKEERHLFLSRYAPSGGKIEEFRMGYTPVPGILIASALERWLTERYCLWTKPHKSLWRVDIWHTPWQLQNVHIEIAENSMGFFMPYNLAWHKPLAHYCAMQKVRFYPPVREPKQKADQSN